MEFTTRTPTRSLTVVNEALVAAPFEGFEKIFDSIAVPYEEAPIDYFRSVCINSSLQPDIISRASAQQLTQPWEEWTLDQRNVFQEEAGQTLMKYGLATE